MNQHNTTNRTEASTNPPPVLLVDDQPANLIALEEVLRPLALRLVSVRSGREALKHLLVEDFAAILLDVQMPEMDGFETAALIKQRERSRYIPILFITAADPDAEFIAQAYSTGAGDYIQKPFDPAVLRSKVSVFVDLFRQREQIRQQAELLRESESRETALRLEVRERERERKHLAELEEREAQLRGFKTTLDATLDGMLLFDATDFHFLYANQGAQRLTNRTAEDLKTKTLPDILRDLDAARFADLIEPLRAKKRPSQMIESEVQRKGGSQVPVEVFLQYVSDRRKRGRFVCLIRDISERRRAEEEKAALLAEVERMARRQRGFLREVLSGLTEGRLRLCDTPQDLPPSLPAFGEPITLAASRLRQLRLQVSAAVDEVTWPIERFQDFETATGEAAMNAVVHGGSAKGWVCLDRTTGTVQVWIRDEGSGIAEEALHRATLERGYSSAGTLGHGFWIMLKTCDRVYLLTGAGGTTVVLEQGRQQPLPGWMQDLPAPTMSNTSPIAAAVTSH